jgi:hypothetical protein
MPLVAPAIASAVVVPSPDAIWRGLEVSSVAGKHCVARYDGLAGTIVAGLWDEPLSVEDENRWLDDPRWFYTSKPYSVWAIDVPKNLTSQELTGYYQQARDGFQAFPSLPSSLPRRTLAHVL